MPKKKIVIAHGYWGRGGAEIATMYLLESVVSDYEVSILSRGGWDLNVLNKAAGTNVLSKDINLIKLPFATLLKQTKGGAIWHALFLRYCRFIASNYDIRITASRVIGWGKPAIHFLSDVVWNKALESEYGEESGQQSVFKKVVSEIGKSLAGKALYELHKEDVFIANSQWTASLSVPYTTTKPIVINPPINRVFETVPWENKLDRFVSFGRISPEKQIEEAIAILDGVRRKGYDIKLTIFGQFGTDDYSVKIQNLVKTKDWVDAPGPIYGDNITVALPQYRYGINACTREAFGISTGEMIKAGIIPFVPLEGAQKELVHNDELIYQGKQEAVSKISDVLSSEKLQLDLQEHLLKVNCDLSSTNFKESVIRVLESLQNTKA